MNRAWLSAILAVAACGAPVASAPVKPVAIAAPVVSVASAVPSVPLTPDAPFRAQEPALGTSSPFVPPSVREEKLATGLRVQSVAIGGSLISLRLVMRGPALFPLERPGVFSLFVNLFMAGTPKRDPTAIRRTLEEAKIEWDTTQSFDAITIDMTMPAKSLSIALDVMTDCILNAKLDTSAIDFARGRRQATADAARASATSLAQNLLSRVVYGPSHPYGKQLDALDGDGKLEIAEVTHVDQELVDSTGSTLVIAGPIDDATLATVRTGMAAWHTRGHHVVHPLPSARPINGPRIYVIDRPNGTQTEIAFGGISPARTSPDWPAMLLAHAVLGARPTSRITRNLREKEKAAWFGGTHFISRHGEGLFYWSGSVSLERTGAVLSSIDHEYAEIRTNPVPQAELSRAADLEIGGAPLWLDTSTSTVSTYSSLPIFDMPAETLVNFAPSVRAVDAAAVKRVAGQYLDPSRSRVVLVGDWSRIAADVSRLGWGPVAICDVSGKVLRTE